MSEPTIDRSHGVLAAGGLRLHIASEPSIHSHVESVLDELRTGYTTQEGVDRASIDIVVSMRISSIPIAQDTAHGRYVAGAEGVYISRWGFWDVRLEGFTHGGSPRAELQLSSDVEGSHYPDGIRMFLRTVMASAAPLVDSLMFHGCALADSQMKHSLLFLGASGDGKTTMTSRLASWTCLGDDTVLVTCPELNRVTVSGTPFAGSELNPRIGCSVPLEDVYFLQPGTSELRTLALDRDESFGLLMRRLMWFVDGGELREQMLDLMGRLTSSLRAARLESSLHHDLSEVFDHPPC